MDHGLGGEDLSLITACMCWGKSYLLLAILALFVNVWPYFALWGPGMASAGSYTTVFAKISTARNSIIRLLRAL